MNVTSELTFTLGREIGAAEGRNSRVFEAVDNQLHAELIVKAYDPATIPDPAEYFAEARMLYDAQHPNVVEVKYACRRPDVLFLAMPRYVESIHAILRRRYLTIREVVRYGLDFLRGLHHIHTRGLVHFDLKPSNILLDVSDKAAVADFGLAKYLDVYGLAAQSRVYDPHLPPEYLVASHRGLESDIYQAGMTLYRMVNGLAGFNRQWAALPTPDEQDAAIASGRFPDRSGSGYLPHVPTRLRRLINKALNVDPNERFATVLDMMNALAKVSEHLDWEYSRPAGHRERVWTMHAETHQKRITHRMQGTEFVLECIKINHRSGAARREAKLSGRFGALQDFRRALTNALTEL